MSLNIGMKLFKKGKKMIEFYKEPQVTPANMAKHNSLKIEIQNLDHEINKAIYNLYNLTSEETNIILNLK